MAVRIVTDALAAAQAFRRNRPSAEPQPTFQRTVFPDTIVVAEFGETLLLEGLTTQYILDARRPNPPSELMRYLSPEELANSRTRASEASEVWTAGVLLWELLADRVLFSASAPAELREQIRRTEVEPLDQIERLGLPVPALLSGIVQQALAPNPERRPQTLHSFERQLTRLGSKFVASSSGVREALSCVFLDPAFGNRAFRARISLVPGSNSFAFAEGEVGERPTVTRKARLSLSDQDAPPSTKRRSPHPSDAPPHLASAQSSASNAPPLTRPRAPYQQLYESESAPADAHSLAPFELLPPSRPPSKLTHDHSLESLSPPPVGRRKYRGLMLTATALAALSGVFAWFLWNHPRSPVQLSADPRTSRAAPSAESPIVVGAAGRPALAHGAAAATSSAAVTSVVPVAPSSAPIALDAEPSESTNRKASETAPAPPSPASTRQYRPRSIAPYRPRGI